MEYATGLPLDMPLICHWNATGMPLYTGTSHCHSLAALTGTAPFKPARATTIKKKTRSAWNVANPYYEHTGNAQCLDTLSPGSKHAFWIQYRGTPRSNKQGYAVMLHEKEQRSAWTILGAPLRLRSAWTHAPPAHARLAALSLPAPATQGRPVNNNKLFDPCRACIVRAGFRHLYLFLFHFVIRHARKA